MLEQCWFPLLLTGLFNTSVYLQPYAGVAVLILLIVRVLAFILLDMLQHGPKKARWGPWRLLYYIVRGLNWSLHQCCKGCVTGMVLWSGWTWWSLFTSHY